MSGVRDRLRAATADVHAALEAALDLGRALQTRDDLVEVLARFHGFFLPLEATLAERLGAEVMTGRHRGPALEADLRSLGCPPAAIAALPVCADAGALATPSDAWGALYVVEGARLGGRIIARDLARRDVARNLQFWPASATAAPSWPDFLRHLETTPDPVLAERGARSTFTRLHAWMTHPSRRAL